MITRNRTPVAAALVAALAWGCSAFEDPTPDQISLVVRGHDGEQVQLAVSKQFVASVDELGVTGVTVFRSDTVVHTLPIDTIVNIALERQFFVEVLPITSDTIRVDVIVDVDDRNLVSERGGIFKTTPWRFVYMFNRQLTRTVEVIL